MGVREWHAEMRALEPEHWPLFVALELDLYERLRDAMVRREVLAGEVIAHRAGLAERGPGAAGWAPDHDAELADLDAHIRSMFAFRPCGYDRSSS